MIGELLVGALNRQSRIRVIAIASTNEELLEVTQKVPVDVALISATLADGPLSGFGALRRIRDCSRYRSGREAGAETAVGLAR